MEEREERYRTKNSSCGEVDYYLPRQHKIESNKCKRFTCGRCFKKEVNKKLIEVVKKGIEFQLFRHLVITLEGEEFRNKLTPDKSFIYITKKWNSFKIYYRRTFKNKFDYILFNRSQKDGYAHLHVLVSVKIPKDWIEDTVRRLNLGWSRIKFVDIHRLKNYLSKYWYKEHEWWIPENKRHFSSSRTIKFEKKKDGEYLLLHWYYDYTKYGKLEDYYTIIEENYGYPPPLDFILGEFYKKEIEVDKNGRK